MKRIITLSAASLLIALQGFCQFIAFPNVNSEEPFDFENPGSVGFNLYEVDPSVLPNQNAFFPEVTSVMSGEWNDPTVWDCNCVPTLENSVTVAPDHEITFNEDKEVYTLHVMVDGILTAEAGMEYSLTVNGDMASYGSLSLNETTLSFGGAESQMMYGNCNATKVYCTGENEVTIDGNLFVSDEMWIGNASLVTSDRLYLTANGDDIGELAPVFNGSLTGNINITKNYEVAQAGFVSLCSPVSNATIATIVDDFPTAGFPGSGFPNFDYSTVFYYIEESDDETTDYAGVTSADDEMVVGRGYYAQAQSGSYSFDVSGMPNVGEIDLQVDYTNNLAPEKDGLNFVANPYPATLNWDSESGWTKENLVGAIYVWDVAKKQFRTYINGLGANGGSAFVKPMETFWVMASGPNPVLGVNEAAKSLHSTETQDYNDSMTLMISNDTWSDEVVITTNDWAAAAFDPAYDALKFYGDNIVPNISTLSEDGVKLAINNMPSFTEATDIEMVVNIPVEGDYTLSFAGVEEYLTNRCMTLEDLVTGEIYDLSVVEEFTFTSASVADELRFILHVGDTVTTEVSNIACHGEVAGSILAQGTGAGPWDYTWYDSDMNELGTTLGETAEFTISDLSAGDYVLEIENNDFCASLSMDLTIDQPETPLEVANWLEHIDCNEDNTGEITLNVSGGLQPYILEWDNELLGANIEDLSPGTYTYTLTDGAGCVRVETLEVTEAQDVEVSFTTNQQIIALDENNQAAVDFLNTSVGTTTYDWDFGDGVSTSTEESPSHVFTEPGFYTVSMYASNGDCDDYYQAVVIVEQYSSIQEISSNSAVSIQAVDGEVIINSLTEERLQVSVEVYDLLGKVIYSEKRNLGNNEPIRLSLDAANSLYMVSVLNLNSGEKTIKKISRF